MTTYPHRIDISEGFLQPLVDLASHVILKKSILIVDDAVAESLRWCGSKGTNTLLRDLGIENIVNFSTVSSLRDPLEIRSLCSNFGLDQVFSTSSTPARGIIILSGYLWDYQDDLKEIIECGGFDELTICCTLTEKAHTCHPNAKQYDSMDFKEFENLLLNKKTCHPKPQQSHYSPMNKSTSPKSSNPPQNNKLLDSLAPHDSWDDWEEEEEVEQEEEEEEVSKNHMKLAIRHLPLHAISLFNGKTIEPPGTFVLTNPICAKAFPLLLSHLDIHSTKMAYESASDILPEDIPFNFRQSFKILAHVLGDLIMQLGLQVKDNIFSIGGTSLKVGHTLLGILENLQEDLTTFEIGQLKPGSLIIMDRTIDLATPCSHGGSLLERILDCIPKWRNPNHVDEDDDVREGLHINEVYPIHSAIPGPYDDEDGPNKDFQASNFISSIPWLGGCSLVNQNEEVATLFKSLACRPAVLALKDLDKALRPIVTGVVQRTGCPKPKKLATDRGRDVVQRWLHTIAEYDPDVTYKHRNLMQYGLAILETLARSETKTFSWESFVNQEARQYRLYAQNAQEWTLPELADMLKSDLQGQKLLKFKDILKLAIHAYSLAGKDGFDEHTSIKVFQEALVTKLLGMDCPEEIASLFMLSSSLKSQLLEHLEKQKKDNIKEDNTLAVHEDDWSWTEDHHESGETNNFTLSEGNDSYEVIQLKLAIEDELSSLLSVLLECGQARNGLKELETLHMKESRVQPTIGQLCNLLVDSNQTDLLSLKHIVDASEQIARAGIDLLKSGFSRFGLGGSSFSGSTKPHPMNNKSIILFIVGGISIQEIEEINEIFSSREDLQVILGGTCIVNGDVILRQLFSSDLT